MQIGIICSFDFVSRVKGTYSPYVESVEHFFMLAPAELLEPCSA